MQVKFAAAYLRVSTEDQTEYSPDAQLSAIRDFAARNGYSLLDEHIFRDEGISGRKAEKRPAFMRMIATAKQKPPPFDAILVHRLDRFARSREDSVVYKALLRRECGVKVISITENIEDDKFAVILEAMLEAMAEYYSLNLSDEVKKGMEEKAKRGGLQTNPSFGYRVENNILVPHPEEAEIIRRVFGMFLEGEGYFTIARYLNDLGVRTRRGNLFENRTVEYILRNPVYIGKLRWTPTGRTRRDFTNPDTLVMDAGHEPLIARETWDAAQERVAVIKAQWRPHMRPASEHRDWPSGLVKCSVCGSTLITTVKNKYWKCSASAKGTCLVSQHITDEKLKEMIISGLIAAAEGSFTLDYQEISRAGKSGSESQSILKRLERLEARMQRVRDAFYGGADSIDEYKAAKELIEKEKASLVEKLNATSEEDGEDKSGLVRQSLRGAINILTSGGASLQDKHRAAHDIIKSIVYDKNAQSLDFVFFLRS